MAPKMRVSRSLAYPLQIGSAVPFQGRVKECADLIESGHRLLDIGCSSGWLSSVAASKGFRNYVGIDRAIVAPESQDHGNSFVEGSVFNLPFRDESFDAVCLFDVIEHLPRGGEERALREIHRILETNGKLYFSTPHASPIHTLLDPVWFLGHRHYRRTTVRRLLTSSNFAVERLFVAGGIVEELDHLRLLTYKHLFRRQQPYIESVTKLIDAAHGSDRPLGMTVFAVAARNGT
jgi:SAM-dependent methyltransferase